MLSIEPPIDYSSLLFHGVTNKCFLRKNTDWYITGPSSLMFQYKNKSHLHRYGYLNYWDLIYNEYGMLVFSSLFSWFKQIFYCVTVHDISQRFLYFVKVYWITINTSRIAIDYDASWFPLTNSTNGIINGWYLYQLKT